MIVTRPVLNCHLQPRVVIPNQNMSLNKFNILLIYFRLAKGDTSKQPNYFYPFTCDIYVINGNHQ